MNDYKLALAYRSRLLLNIGIISNIQGFDPQYKLDTIDNLTKNILDHFGNRKVDVRKLSENELLTLGFKRYRKDKGLFMFPIWLMPFAEDFEVECITGYTRMLSEHEVYASIFYESDCLTSGFRPKPTEEDNQKRLTKWERTINKLQKEGFIS